ncbi:MogA/MoaB family molybdenum cofactor biosynthesis protein [Mobiluncus curtisii]|uniref:MogA/MoaB family molybdenum cofactor biosynthesis protein n=1 Tax=Mobiluncus curtisii TaxID=2051 RepID=UPI0001E0E13D|nr:MogA/MoaB family molybdenum cofactor biosynthesis protein [Mobiluncus curtisii]EFL94331.1 molybdenum cofactor synthesis domain protein [Mobiluncus curtisii subsp. curtisii ATCC 35241]QQT13079.1 MogA/MoaB family molybdenum cofactor biosynthesis protein [Mobiluncus curtisii]STY77299.1 Molybdenum cofactor biosynthesis protein B [Mobiluncus curtisii subsp. curtisii]
MTHAAQSLPPETPAYVITVSDSVSAGVNSDRSGPLAVEMLSELGFVLSGPMVVPDGVDSVHQAVAAACHSGARLVFTTGGTGISPRDLTPEAVESLVVARLSGAEAALLERNRQAAPLGMLSRPVVGISTRQAGAALVVCAPGSPGAVRDTIEVLTPVLGHVLEILDRTNS